MGPILFYAMADEQEPGVYVRFDCVAPHNVSQPVRSYASVIIDVVNPPWCIPDDQWVGLVVGKTPATQWTMDAALHDGPGRSLTIDMVTLSASEQERLRTAFAI